MAGPQKFDVFMSKYSIWTAYKSGLGLKFGGRPHSHQLIIQEVFFKYFQVKTVKKTKCENRKLHVNNWRLVECRFVVLESSFLLMQFQKESYLCQVVKNIVSVNHIDELKRILTGHHSHFWGKRLHQNENNGSTRPINVKNPGNEDKS